MVTLRRLGKISNNCQICRDVKTVGLRQLCTPTRLRTVQNLELNAICSTKKCQRPHCPWSGERLSWASVLSKQEQTSTEDFAETSQALSRFWAFVSCRRLLNNTNLALPRDCRLNAAFVLKREGPAATTTTAGNGNSLVVLITLRRQLWLLQLQDRHMLPHSNQLFE